MMLLLTACSGGSSTRAPMPVPDEDFDASAPLVNNADRQRLEVLLIGNSHSVGLQPVLESLMRSALPARDVTVELAAGSGFLADRVGDGVTRATIESANWSHVVLQAQKYSTSGTRSYPTDAAEYWIRGTRQQGATPVLFPEHPRRGNGWESDFLLELHQGIAAREPACVAAIGQVWDEVKFQDPALDLYEADGNHASGAGHLLNAMIFYEVLTGEAAESLPDIPASGGVPVATQRMMRTAVSNVLHSYPPCPM